jgi:hypothetical protein
VVRHVHAAGEYQRRGFLDTLPEMKTSREILMRSKYDSLRLSIHVAMTSSI